MVFGPAFRRDQYVAMATALNKRNIADSPICFR
jgi:hypothetical protein